jgi:hypothetical protein
MLRFGKHMNNKNKTCKHKFISSKHLWTQSFVSTLQNKDKGRRKLLQNIDVLIE